MNYRFILRRYFHHTIAINYDTWSTGSGGMQAPQIFTIEEYPITVENSLENLKIS